MEKRHLGIILIFFASVLTARAGLLRNPDCVVYLGFDRYTDGDLYDTSSHNNNAKLENGVSITKVEGSCGECAQILGGDIKLNGKTFTGLPFMQITIAMMVQLMVTDGSYPLFQTIGEKSADESPQYLLEVEDGRIRWFHRNEQTIFSVITDTLVLETGHWTHIAGTYDGLSGKAEIYVNGKLMKQEVRDPGRFLSTDWGKYAGIGMAGGDPQFRGYIDEFYIFNRTLPDIAIAELMKRCEGPKKNLVLQLSFDNMTPLTSPDNSGMMNDATLPMLMPGTVRPVSPGTCGNGIALVGGPSDIKLNGLTFRNKPTDEITVAMWFNMTLVKDMHYLFNSIGGHSMHNHNQYLLCVANGALCWVHHNENDEQVFNVNTDTILVPAKWYHVAGTYSAKTGQAKLYLNGDLKGQGVGHGVLSEDWDKYVAFGRHPGDINNIDYLDEIYLYNRALEPFEIKSLYDKCNFADDKSTISLLMYLGFDRVAGKRVFDDSGNNNNAILTNNAAVAKSSGNCGSGMRLSGGNILLNGRLLKRKPIFGITICLWIKLDNNRGDQELFMTTNPDSPANKHAQYLFEVIDGKINWFHRNALGQTVFSAETTNPVVPAGTWTHVCGTYAAGPGTSEIYVNGELKKQEFTGSGVLSQDWDGKVSIGKFYDFSDEGRWIEARQLVGTIDEFYMYDKPLLQNEIKALSETCNFHRIVVHLGFEKYQFPTNDITLDQSGLSNNGKVINGTFTLPVNGTCGHAINITGTAVITINGTSFKEKPIDAISISVWVKLTTNRGRHQIFDTIGGYSLHLHDQYDFAVEEGKIIWKHHDMEDKEVFAVTSLPIIPANIWTHIVVTYDSSTQKARIYVNGKLQKQDSGAGLLSQDWGHFAGIGLHFYQKTYFKGIIDEFLMYNYALNEKEIEYLAHPACAK